MSHPANLPEREITPEAVVNAKPAGSSNTILSRRRFLKWTALGGVALGAGAGLWWWRTDHATPEEVLARGHVPTPTERFYPARIIDPRFRAVDRPITQEEEAARWCNFYEFTADKDVHRYVGSFQAVPWTLEVRGMIARPRTFDLDDLLRTFAGSFQERVYRHRCVEAWAMVVPWTGFPLAELVNHVQPQPRARFLRFVTFDRPEQAPEQRNRLHNPWPYTEGLTLAEATNELAFIATGMYSHPLLKQNGAPVRLVVPWKYGFKSAKSLVRIEFTDIQPATFWNTLAPQEYDFSANVNPDVPHPRWSQRSERMLGTDERHPTRLFNGYGDWVGHLYQA
jgi:sulfoxide reductase catalytic subunit YedY